MGLRRWVIKAYHHDWWIPGLSIATVVLLVGTMVLFVLFAIDQRDERVRSRETDQTLCAFANDLRRDVRDIGQAGEDMVQGIVDIVLPADATNGERAAAIARIRDQLEPVFEQHRLAVAQIRLIDCASVTGSAAGRFP